MPLAEQFWMETILQKMPVRFPYSVLLLSGSLYVLGVFFAAFGGINVGVSFLLSERVLGIATMGIMVTFVVAEFIRKNCDKVLADSGKCFSVSTERYRNFVSGLNSTWRNKYGSLLGGSIAIGSIIAFAISAYPKPLFRETPTYTIYDWYVLAVFALVMLIIGSGSWGVISVSIKTKEIRNMPIDLDRVRELQPLIRTILYFLAGWFIGTGLVYLALPVEYTVATTVVGYIGFVVPQVNIHSSIVLAKNQALENLGQRRRDARSKFEQTSVDEKESYLEAVTLSAISNMIRDVEETREWPINYSQFMNLAVSSIIPIAVRYALTRSF
jgi:hypothetical protein